ncbi:MAG: hypothetical protein H7839_23195, partial [Magnetococcus sp. YQC-5]
DSLDCLLSIEPDVKKDLTDMLMARVVDISKPKIEQDISVTLRHEQTFRMLSEYLHGKDGGSARTLKLVMSLNENKYKMLSHAKTVYPNDVIGRSLILSVLRVHTILREPQLGVSMCV